MSKKNLALTSLLFYVTLSSASAWANFFNSLNENIASIKNKEPVTIDIAVGTGLQVNTLMANDGDSMNTTNRNLYILGINVNNKTKLSAMLPFKDPDTSLEARVNSDVRAFSLGFDFTKNLKGAAFYSKNKGYVLETSQEQKIYRLPDLEFNLTGANFYWLYNPEHQSIYLDPYVYDQGKDSSSWISLLGLNQTELKHLEQTRQLPTVNQNLSLAEKADIYSIAFRQLYSRNWFWEHWFVTSAFGYGVNFDQIKETNTTQTTKSNTSSANTVLSVSGGYLAKRWGLSAFANITQATYKTENLRLNSNISTNGLYFTYQF